MTPNIITSLHGCGAIEAETHTRNWTEDNPDTGSYSNEPLADEECTRI